MVDALFVAGCGDAVLGFGQPGLIGLSFSREGADAETVIRRAVAEAIEALRDGSSLREVRLGIA